MRSRFFVAIISFFLFFNSLTQENLFSQNIVNVDSLKQALIKHSPESENIKTYFKIINHYSNSNLDSALKYLYIVQTISEKGEKGLLLSDIKFQFGSVFFLKGDYYHSLDFYQQFLKLTQKDTSKVLHRGACLSNMGNIYYFLKDYSLALINYKTALALFEKTNNKYFNSYKSPLINNIGNVYDMRGQKDSAIIMYRLGRHEAMKAKDFENLSKIENNLGDIYLELNQLDSSNKYLSSAFKIRKDQNDLYGLISSYKNLGLYYRKTHDHEKALEYFLKSTQLSRQVNEISSLNESLGLISELYSEKGDYKNAYENFVSYKQTADSLFNDKMIKEITALELNYKFEAERQKKLLEDNKKRTKNIISFISLVFIILIILLLYFLSLSKSKRITLTNNNLTLEKKNLKLVNQNLEQSLEIKNKELTTNVLYLIKKNELINLVSKKLLSLKTNLKTENQSPLQQIIYELQRGAEADVWNDFEIRFQNVHLDFYKRLEEKYPDLSTNEKRLCAFIRLKMNSKEISTLLNINLKSVIVARTRLRKKLNITNSEIVLEQFLSEI